jgi:HD-like signal output (HDOD) protein
MVSITALRPDQLERTIRERLLSDRVRIPPYPAVLARFQQCANSGRLDEIARLVAADSALAAAVLARASSVLYGGHTGHLAFAISRLGMDELLKLALTTSVAPLALGSGPLSALRRDAWRRALLGAHITEILAKTSDHLDETFAAGLLHDLGEVVALACIEDIGRDHALPALDVAGWRRIIQRVHVDLGMMLAARWNLPEPIAIAMACHHELPAGPHADLVALVALADRVVDVLDRSPGTGIAALLEVPGVSSAARYAIGAALVDIATEIACFETSPAPAPSPIVLRAPPPDGWPIDVAAERPRRGTYRARRISPDALQLTGAEPLTVNWLIDLKLATSPPLVLLVNIVSCEPGPGGEHTIVASPFGLDGDAKAGWLALLETARASAA